MTVTSIFFIAQDDATMGKGEVIVFLFLKLLCELASEYI